VDDEKKLPLCQYRIAQNRFLAVLADFGAAPRTCSFRPSSSWHPLGRLSHLLPYGLADRGLKRAVAGRRAGTSDLVQFSAPLPAIRSKRFAQDGRLPRCVRRRSVFGTPWGLIEHVKKYLSCVYLLFELAVTMNAQLKHQFKLEAGLVMLLIMTATLVAMVAFALGWLSGYKKACTVHGWHIRREDEKSRRP
jgi:hypothetical protein